MDMTGNGSDALGLLEAALPSPARRTIDALEEGGYESWCVGGFVRDALMGRPVHDVDIATAAPWQEASRVLAAAGARVHETGTAHGTITAVVDGEPIEVTTFRVDGTYRDGRHPDSVTFVSSIEEDLARRDFTVNALAYHPRRGILDPFGGRGDLEAGVLRAVGDPRRRFEEDALRILRACRFASQLGFALDEAAYQAAVSQKSLLARMSRERIARELDGFVCGDHVHDALLATVDILSFVLPELVAMRGFEQRTPYHIYDVLEHTAWVMQHSPAEPVARWAALCHDMGKPAAAFTGPDGVGHFYGHAAVSVALATGLFERLGMPTAVREAVLALVRRHDDVIEPTPRSVRRALNRLGGDPGLFRALCALKRADALSQAPRCAPRAQLADELVEVMERVLADEGAFTVRGLAVDGRAVMALGIPQGPAVGDALQAALEAVMDERVPNEPKALETFIRETCCEQAPSSKEPTCRSTTP